MWMPERTRTPGPTADERDAAKLRELRAAAVLIVEDTIDATSDGPKSLCSYGCSCLVPTERTGEAIVNALTEAGWTHRDITDGAAQRARRPDRLVIDVGEGTLMVRPTPNGGTVEIRAGGLFDATSAFINRDDAVALRDWINAALTSGAIR